MQNSRRIVWADITTPLASGAYLERTREQGVDVPQLPDLEVKEIEQYVNSQTHDATDRVRLVQKVGSRRIALTSYDLYDVWTEKGNRWWVITNPTNLYAQEAFNDIDQVFTYHLGVRAILFDRPQSTPNEHDDEKDMASDPPWYAPALRRYQRAVDVMTEAQEAEDFQAVGIRCREALLSYVKHGRHAEWAPEQTQPPQAANFKAWADIFAEALATGKHRSYLKALADKTWDLTVWLQHYSGATEWDAEVVLSATRHFLMTFGLAHRHFVEDPPTQCPTCDSYRVRYDEDIAELDGREGWSSQPVCLGCGWRGERTFEPFSADYLRSVAEYIDEDEEETTTREAN